MPLDLFVIVHLSFAAIGSKYQKMDKLRITIVPVMILKSQFLNIVRLPEVHDRDLYYLSF